VSSTTGTPEELIRIYGKDPSAIDQMAKRAGGDESRAADEIRRRASQKIQAAKKMFGAQADDALKAAAPGATEDIGSVVARLEDAKAALDPRIKTDAQSIAHIDDLIGQVLALSTDGKATVQDMHKIKQVLQGAAKPSYDAGGNAIFQGGPKAAQAAKGAAAEARIVTNRAAPLGYKHGNKRLELLHRLEERMNRNLVREGTSDSALTAAGSGTNARNARVLDTIDRMTGTNLKEDAGKLAAMKAFSGGSNLLNQIKTGRSVLGAVTGTALGEAADGHEGGSIGGAIGVALSSPLALKQVLRTNAAVRGALGSFAGVLESAAARGPQALQATIGILSRKPEFLQALESAGTSLSPAVAQQKAPDRSPAKGTRR
jgi:hypothetical protein